MTTGISLVRENAASMQPPRSLWVSFPLGRPLGKPNDADFQHDVIRSALSLLQEPVGPVLEDYPRDAPEVRSEDAPACPVSFQKQNPEEDGWVARLEHDLATVMPWYDLSRRRRGRTLVGLSSETPEANIVAIGKLLDDGELPLQNLQWFKHAIEDLKVLYLEAFSAQPGDHDTVQMQRMLWQESCLGTALIEFYHRLSLTGDQRLAMIARLIVPREAVGEDIAQNVLKP